VLRRLRIENLVLIREAELAFASGLNAITGETGAGKTILAQAIGLLLGAKGEAGYVGPGAPEAYVEAELDLPEGLLDEEGFEAIAELRPEDEDGLVLARRVTAEGRTRAYAWGRSVPREELAGLAERLEAVLARHPGGDEVVLHVVVGSREVIVNADRYHVLAGPALAAEIDELVGQTATRLETVRPKAQSNGNGRGRR
jgi:energy-coupling factor transporter ATP-binding protein EcfA2